MKLNEYSLLEISKKLNDGEVTSEELTKACLSQIDATSNLNALNTVCSEMALEKAKEVDKKRASGEKLSTLAGVPIVIKDNIVTKGIRTTCSSKMLENFVPPYNATVVDKLSDLDAVIVGKANMDEFAMGSSNETSYFGKVLNPVDTTCVPGGSSGGSACTVASKQVFASLGSDTGGSIRQPASLCGIVGLKPTYGLVSRYGLIAFASSLDQIGPFTRTVKDSAVMLNAISGHDEKDSTSVDIKKTDYLSCIKGDIKGLRIGICKDLFIDGLNSEIKEKINNAIDFYKNNGAEIVDIKLPYINEMLSVYYIISSAEAASNLARFDGVKYGYRAKKFSDIVDLYIKSRTEGFGSEVKRRIMLGNYVLSSGYYDAYYLKALKVKTLVKQAYDKAFESCDVILSPTSPCTAFKIGEKVDDPVTMYLSDVYTVSSNITGNPAISIPCGFDSKGLPIGMQLIGKPFSEGTLFNVADFFESKGER